MKVTTNGIVEKILCAQDGKREKGREVLVKWHGYQKKIQEPLEGIEETLALNAFKKEHGNTKENDGLWGLHNRHTHRKRQRTRVLYFQLSKEIEKEKAEETEELNPARLRSCGRGQ